MPDFVRYAAGLGVAGLMGAAVVAGGVHAQSASPLGGFRHDQTQPIEIAADSLEVREADKIAVFRGGVVAGQGAMRLTANELEVNYAGEGTGQIRRLQARGDVFISNDAETATGDYADYDVSGGSIRMTGGVTLTQGENVVKGESLTIDLTSGQGRVDGGGGRVRSVFTPSRDAGSSDGEN